MIYPKLGSVRPIQQKIKLLWPNIFESFDDSYKVRGVFCDVSKAFNEIWHNGFIFKVQENGILGNLLKVLKHSIWQLENKGLY